MRVLSDNLPFFTGTSSFTTRRRKELNFRDIFTPLLDKEEDVTSASKGQDVDQLGKK